MMDKKEFSNLGEIVEHLENEGHEVDEEFKEELNSKKENKTNKEELTEEEKENKKTSQLYAKLLELQEKLKTEELSPIKRAWILAKLAIIETKLENQLNKLEMKTLAEKFKNEKKERFTNLGKTLENKYKDYNDTLKEKLELEREIEGITSDIKNMEKEFKEINNAGKINGQEIPYEFKVDDLSNEKLKDKKNELNKVSEKYKQMKDEIIKMKEEFADQEKETDKENEKALKEYKPSFWKTITTSFGKVKNVVKDYFADKKAARKVAKDAKAKAKAEYYSNQNNVNLNEMGNKMKDFKGKIDAHISQEEQLKFTKNVVKTESKTNDLEENIEK